MNEGSNSTRIINLGTCVDNKDPLGLGRIRVQTYSDSAGPLVGAMKYEAWDDKDPFIALPFLPTNINYIPKEGQAVKIINHSPEKDIVNREYIAGPFTTIHDFNPQLYSSQVKDTTYGGGDSSNTVIVDKKTGEVIDSFVKTSIAKENDYAIYGKDGSDIIFTEAGVSLRGGKFIPRTMLMPKLKANTYNKPYMSEKTATLHLKKYENKQEYYEDVITETVTEFKPLKSIIEYDIDRYDGGDTTINFYVYLIGNADSGNKQIYGGLYQTNNSKLSTVPIVPNLTKLITTGSTYTFSVTVLDILSFGVRGVYKKIRNVLKKIHTKGTLEHIDPKLPFAMEDLHPFYFRPTTGCTNTVLSSTGLTTNRVEILNNVILATGVGPQSGLVFAKDKMSPQTKTIEKKIKRLRNTPLAEQTFSSIKSDQIYFISQDVLPPTNEIRIDFNKLDKYELSQDNYMVDLLPHTYSTVRGEKLINLLQTIVDLLYSHQHQLTEPLSQDDPNYLRLFELMKTLKYDILNNKIRIN